MTHKQAIDGLLEKFPEIKETEEYQFLLLSKPYYKVFSKERYDYLCKQDNDIKLSWTWRDFTTEETMAIIENATFNELDQKMAILKKIKHKTNEEISNELFVDIKTVGKHCNYITFKITQTAIRMFPSEDLVDFEIPEKYQI